MKKAALHTAVPMHGKARQVLHDLFSINQGNGSEVTFVALATKVNLKNLKSLLWLDDLMQETIWRHQLYIGGISEPLTSSGKTLAWAYKLKALKSA